MDIFAISQASNWVERKTLPDDFTKHDSSPFYFPFVEYQVQVDEGLISSYCHSFEIINDASRIENASLQSHELNPESEKIIFHDLKIIRGDSVIDVLHEDSINVIQRERSLESHITNQKLTVNISIDDLRVKDGIEYAYTIVESESQHPLQGKVFDALYWVNWGCPVESQRVRCINNSQSELTVTNVNHGHEFVSPTTEVIKSGEIFDKTFNNLVPGNVDKSAPNWIWSSHIQISTAQTWAEISSNLYRFYAQQNIDELLIKLDEIDLLELSGNVADDIIQIVRFVQDNVRYKGEHEGIHSHVPRSPDIVLRKRSGDCKDKSNLLVNLLTKLGVESRLLLVNTSYGRNLPEKSPCAYRFNHMIVEVFYENKSYFFDSTIQKQRGDIENISQLSYSWALPITESGRGLIELPFDFSRFVFNLHHQFDFRESAKSEGVDGILEIRRKFCCHRADNFRYFFSSTEYAQIEKDFLDYAKGDTELSLSVKQGPQVVNDDERKNVFETIEQYHIHNVAETHKEKRVELLTKFYQDLPSDASGKYPIQLELDGSLEHSIDIFYDKAQRYDDSENIVKNQYFNYRDKVTSSPDSLKFRNCVKLEDDIVLVDDVPSYLNDVKDIRSRCNNLFPWHSIDKEKKKISWWWLILSLIFLSSVIIDNFKQG